MKSTPNKPVVRTLQWYEERARVSRHTVTVEIVNAQDEFAGMGRVSRGSPVQVLCLFVQKTRRRSLHADPISPTKATRSRRPCSAP